MTSPVILPWLVLALAAIAQLATFWLLRITPGASFSPVMLAFFAYAAVGAVVAARRPGHQVGWLLCVVGFVAQIQGLVSVALEYAVAPTAGPAIPGWLLDPWLMAPLRNLWVVSETALALLLLVFPNGRLFSRPLARGSAVALALAAFGMSVGLVTAGSVTPPLAMRFPLLDALFSADVADRLYRLGRTVSGISLLALLVFCGISMAVRLRRTRGVERQQMKWFAYAAVMLVATFVATAAAFFSPLRALDPGAPIPFMMFGGVPVLLALIGLPLGAAIAILRYRLYDIDVLINRTLVYLATSSGLLATYVVSVLALGSALRPLTGSGDLAVAGSTLVVVALFQPVRRRVQHAVDRRFYRSHYDAARTLDAFSVRLRDEVDLDEVRSGLVGVVHDALRPSHVSVWLREARR